MNHLSRTAPTTGLDSYYTPEWATIALIEFSEVLQARDFERAVEPCAGQGHMARVLESAGYEVDGSDIDQTSPYHRGDGTDDVLSQAAAKRHSDASLVVTNPPYSSEWASAADVASAVWFGWKPDVLALLTRLTWQEPCKDRYDLLQWMREVIVLPRFDYINGDENNNCTSNWIILERLEDGKPAELPTYYTTVTPSQKEKLEHRANGQEALL